MFHRTVLKLINNLVTVFLLDYFVAESAADFRLIPFSGQCPMQPKSLCQAPKLARNQRPKLLRQSCVRLCLLMHLLVQKAGLRECKSRFEVGEPWRNMIRGMRGLVTSGPDLPKNFFTLDHCHGACCLCAICLTRGVGYIYI